MKSTRAGTSPIFQPLYSGRSASPLCPAHVYSGQPVDALEAVRSVGPPDAHCLARPGFRGAVDPRLPGAGHDARPDLQLLRDGRDGRLAQATDRERVARCLPHPLMMPRRPATRKPWRGVREVQPLNAMPGHETDDRATRWGRRSSNAQPVCARSQMSVPVVNQPPATVTLAATVDVGVSKTMTTCSDTPGLIALRSAAWGMSAHALPNTS